jgi:hypothetical protein
MADEWTTVMIMDVMLVRFTGIPEAAYATIEKKR